MKNLAAWALLALVCACSAGPDEPATRPNLAAADVRVTTFMKAYRQQSFRGLPNADQAAALAPHFSVRLNALLRDAIAGQQAYKARFPRDKPPMIDGDIFSSLFEGATSGAVDKVDEGQGTATVRVHFTYSDPGTSQAIESWHDRFILVREGTGWVIDDLEYLGKWDFAPRGRLSAALTETASLGK